MSNVANASQPLIGHESTAVPGRFGEPPPVEYSVTSRGGFDQHPTHPLLFLCLHGWGPKADMAGVMRLIAPYNDFVALRGPLALAKAPNTVKCPATTRGSMTLCRSAMILIMTRDAAATAIIDRWLPTFPLTVPVPLGFSQGGLSPCIYCASIPSAIVLSYRCLVSTRSVKYPRPLPPTIALANYDIPVFYLRQNDGVIPKCRIIRYCRLA